jgi:hypothetical protein
MGLAAVARTRAAVAVLSDASPAIVRARERLAGLAASEAALADGAVPVEALSDIESGLREVGEQLDLACRPQGWVASDEALGSRLRRFAREPVAWEVAGLTHELEGRRSAFAVIAADPLVGAPGRAAALAAAWAIDDLAQAITEANRVEVRRLTIVAIPPLELAARHERARAARAVLARPATARAEALRSLAPEAAKLAGSGGAAVEALLAELAADAGWPERLLRPARDRLRRLADELRRGREGDAVQSLVEAAWAIEIEAARPGIPAPERLLACARTMRAGAGSRPGAEQLAAAADAIDHLLAAPLVSMSAALPSSSSGTGQPGRATGVGAGADASDDAFAPEHRAAIRAYLQRVQEDR